MCKDVTIKGGIIFCLERGVGDGGSSQKKSGKGFENTCLERGLCLSGKELINFQIKSTIYQYDC